jgi:hypothetical protein
MLMSMKMAMEHRSPSPQMRIRRRHLVWALRLGGLPAIRVLAKVSMASVCGLFDFVDLATWKSSLIALDSA